MQSVTKSLAGDYTCLAANTEGRGTSNPVTLRVRCEFLFYFTLEVWVLYGSSGKILGFKIYFKDLIEFIRSFSLWDVIKSASELKSRQNIKL